MTQKSLPEKLIQTMIDQKIEFKSYTSTQFYDFMGIITLHHSKMRNALSRELVEEVISALNEFTKKKVRVVILRAHPGSSVWSAGHNVKELPEKGKDPLSEIDPLRRLIAKIKLSEFPVIASVEGGVFGGANEVVAACDIVIAADNATFKFTPARMGVPYDRVGLLTMINAVGLRAAKEMIFTARTFDATWAEAHGLVSRVVPLSDLEKETLSEAEDIAKNAPLAIRSMKYTLGALSETALPFTVFGREDFLTETYRFKAYSSNDYEEGKRAFFEKRAPVFKGE